jgi:hypothetical protein
MNINDICGIVVAAMLFGAVTGFAVLICNVHNQAKRNSSKRAEAQALR